MEATILNKKKGLVPKLRLKGFEGAWKTALVNDLASKLNVGFVGTCEPFYTSSEEGVLLVRTGNLKGVKIILDEEKYVTKEFNDKNKKSQIFPGDLLLARHGGNGEICMVPKGFPIANSLNIVILRTSSEIDSTYFQLTYSTFSIQKQISSVTAGSTQGVINTSEIGKLKITFPSLPEQQKIASFLSAVDEKIQQLTRKKDLLEQYKKGVMQQLFAGKLRFKDENGKAFSKWEEKKIGEITTLLKDGTHGTHKDCPEGQYYLLSAKNIVNGSIKIDDTDRKISEEEYNSIYKNYKLEENDILLTIVGTIGRVAIYKLEQNIAFQRSVAFFRFKDQSADFLFQLMNESKFQKQLNLKKVISAQPGIYLGDLAKIPVKLPCLEEQKKIANYLSNIDYKIESVNKQINQTQTFKKGLLQQMFV